MHEMSYAVRIAEIVVNTAEKENIRHVKKVKVRCGEMLAIVPALLETAFAACAEGTIAEDAGFEIETVPVLIRCTVCGRLIDPHGAEGYVAACPGCGSPMLKIVNGREFTVAGIEGETEV